MKSEATQLDLLSGSALRDAPSFRNDRELMMLPFFTLGKTPRHTATESRWVEEGGVEFYIRNSPGEDGLPTMWDQDILIYIETLIVQAMNRGEPTSPRVRFHIHDCLQAIRRRPGGTEYRLFHQSLKRLKGTTVFTNVTSGDAVEDGGFGWIQGFRLGRQRNASGKEVATYCEVTLCDWLYTAIVKDKRVLALDPEYFQLDSGLERKLYQIIRGHIGSKTSWRIGLDRLHVKTGSTSPRKRFHYEIRQMVERDPFPAWSLCLTHDGRLNGLALPGQEPIKSGKPVFLLATRR